jgi:hypothetical protein
MPYAEAQAAHAEAQQILNPLHDVHEREGELLRKCESSADPLVRHAIHAQIDDLRTEWADLFSQYTDAIARYTVALQNARGRRERLR